MSSPKIIRTPKAYYVTRRLEGHSDWAFGFWRELFQNANDAGAKRIDITVSDADGKGSFGREATVERVVRVTFADDGKGMNDDVLENVFFQPGETTKRSGDTTGGFGTARLMLCFSQARYGIRTQDWVVEGDGSEYTVLTVPQAIEAKRAEIAAAVADEDADVGRVEQLRADLAALEADQGTAKGCKFEIDIDPNESPNYWRNVDRQKLLDKLDDYLSMSQMSAKVFLNGEEVAVKALKGPAKRKLVANVDGREVEFGTIHTSQGERAKHKGKIIVRSNGSAMFTEETSSSHQVIVELDPELSKQILTENRDGLKHPYRSALAGFVEELVVDTKSALEEKDKRKHIEIKGGLGKLRAAAPAPKVSFSAQGTVRKTRAPEPMPLPSDEQIEEMAEAAAPHDHVPGATADAVAKELPMARYTTPEEYEVQGFGGVPKRVMDEFIETVAKGEEETFLQHFEAKEAVQRFVAAAREAVETGNGAAALKTVTPELGEFVAATIAERMVEAGVRQRAEERYADLHDIHIHVEDIADSEKLKNALRRHHPNYWRRKGEHLEGRGIQAHMLLAAWTVCVKHAVNALLAYDPSLGKQGAIDYATGWMFAKSERQWTSRGYKDVRTSAHHQERDGLHVFALNPVFDNGQPAYDLTKERRTSRFEEDGSEAQFGIQDIIANSIHEACHVMDSRHDEEFANIQTAVTALFDHAAARKEMREALDAVRAIYGRGRARIQALDVVEEAPVLEADDDKPAKAEKKARKPREPRPAERLLAHAAPLTTMVVGTAAAPENQDFPADGLKEAFAGAVTPVAEGVVEVDCDRIQELEAGLSVAAAHDWDAPIALDAIEVDAQLSALATEESLQGLAALAAEPVAPVPAQVARGTVWEAPIDLGAIDEIAALDAPDLSALDGLNGLAALAAEMAPPAAAPVAAPAPIAPAPVAPAPVAPAPVAPAAPAPVAPSGGFSYRPPQAAASADGWDAPIDIEADFPPVFEDPALDQLAQLGGALGGDFAFDDLVAEEGPEPEPQAVGMGMR